MAYNFKEVMSRPERLVPGHRMCAGCGATVALR
ncbi:MAG TPA: pyruvate ferredoxin oxidoreductase, partial [Anaerovoracaceae bacterium]|nr:pyruvate ferredoxin oxidoreductase [Anaerovoracaceae bacterium]